MKIAIGKTRIDYLPEQGIVFGVSNFNIEGTFDSGRDDRWQNPEIKMNS